MIGGQLGPVRTKLGGWRKVNMAKPVLDVSNPTRENFAEMKSRGITCASLSTSAYVTLA